jgi:hypothetical protein
VVAVGRWMQLRLAAGRIEPTREPDTREVEPAG